MIDVIIIGAGPAGIQAAYYLQKENFSIAVLEKSEAPGAFFRQYPRHRTLISINKKYTGSQNSEFNLRHDWNSLLSDDGPKFTQYDDELFPNADKYVDYLQDFVNSQDIPIRYKAEVSSITKDKGVFCVQLSDGESIESQNVIVATGYGRTNRPDIQGIEHAVDYSVMSIDKTDFIDQRVLIIGKGNSAFETADHLAGVCSTIHLLSPTPLNLAWQTHYVGHLRAVNNNVLDMYQLKSQHAVLDATPLSIIKDDQGYHVEMAYTHAQGEVESLCYDRVLCCAGFKFDASIFSDSCRPNTKLNGKFPELDPSYQSVNVPGLYFAGTLTHGSDFRKGTSGFVHGFRYNARALTNILNHRIKNKNIACQKISGDTGALATFLINRFNEVSSVWQQPAILAEVIKLDGAQAEYYEALPVDYAVKDYFKNDRVVLITFEYGEPIDGDIFKQNRIARDNYDQAHNSNFLHPVMRYYEAGELKKEFHVIEDLESHWTCTEHLEHIAGFIRSLEDMSVCERYSKPMNALKRDRAN